MTWSRNRFGRGRFGRAKETVANGTYMWSASALILCIHFLSYLSFDVSSSSVPRLLEASTGSADGIGLSIGLNETEASSGNHVSPVFHPMIFFLVAYLLSAASQQVVEWMPPMLQPPHSVVLYVFGLLLALFGGKCPDTELGEAINMFSRVDPHVIFWIFLPMLLYEDGADCQWHVMKKVLPSAILLAFPGVLVNALLTAGILVWPIGMSAYPALLLGSILSATDPVAVMAALQELQAPASLSSLIAGEALLNDGSGVVMFQIFFDVTAGRKPFLIVDAIISFLRLSLGGPGLGLAAALLAHVWIQKTKVFSIEILVIMVCVFGCFFVADHPSIRVSGVLAVVTFGYFFSAIGKYGMTIEKEHEHHAIVHCFAFLSNEAIFVIAGVVGFHFSFDNKGWYDWINLLILYIGVHLTRAVVLIIHFPLLCKMGYHLTIREAIICWYGGLRGGVGLAMALIVLGDHDMDAKIREDIAFFVNGIVLGTLFINGMTVTPVYKRLQIVAKDRVRHHNKYLEMVCRHADARSEQKLLAFSQHWFFSGCNMDIVRCMVPCLTDGIDKASEDCDGKEVDHHAITSKVIVDAMLQLAQVMQPSKQELEQLERELKKPHTNPNVSNFNLFSESPHYDGNATESSPIEGLNIPIVETTTMASNEEKVQRPIFKTPAPPPCCSGSIEEISLAGNLDRDTVAREFYLPSQISEMLPRQLSADRMERSLSRETHASSVFSASTPNSLRVNKLSMLSLQSVKSLDAHFGDGEVNGFLAEIYQTLVNSSRAAYKHMYERGTLNRSAYEILRESTEYQDDAILGRIFRHSFLVGEYAYLRHESVSVQMKASIRVAWLYIVNQMQTTSDPLLACISKCAGRRSVSYEWLMIERDVKVLLAYALTTEGFVNELNNLKQILGNAKRYTDLIDNHILIPMGTLVRECQEQLARRLKQDAVMFGFYRHILFARLVLVEQADILKKLAAEGVVFDTDAEEIIDDMIIPAANAVASYVPTMEVLKLSGSPNVRRFNSMMERAITAVNQITLRPIE